MELINNIEKTLRDDLSIEIKDKSKVSIAAACFSIYAFQELKKQLADVSKHNTERVLQCSHLVVFNVVNNLEFFEKQISENLPEGAINYYKTYLKPRPEEEIKSRMKNQIYISLGVFLAACASMEIDATPMEGIENEKYTEILGLENHFTTFAVCLGKRDSEDSNQPKFNPKKRVAMEKIVSEI